MGGFSVVQSPPRFVDTGQGASGRLASWMAWVSDPNPLMGPESTIILRTEDNGAASGDPNPLPLGTGGCGTWSAVLDGFSNGATSGGDNCFIINFPISIPLVDDFGTQIEDDGGGGTFDVGSGNDTSLPFSTGPYAPAFVFCGLESGGRIGLENGGSLVLENT